ncbi:MAG: adenylate/guanylate cyclase domain-containing protein [Pseudomonadota bacterium]
MTDVTADGKTSPLARLDIFIFGARPPENLPERARRGVARAQTSAEILVTLAQIGAIVFFGVVYKLTPKAFPADAPFEPVPYLLAFYAIFTALRLYMALTDQLSRPIQFVSIAVDMAVLTLTIWSFHIQYGVAPSVYLKAPTLLYVFILITLRAMRMEADQVIFAGFCAVIGYIALAGYAIETAGMEMITSDWAKYMTSDAILIGAEVDKLLAISVVTAVLAVAVTRARRMLLVAAAEKHAAEELSRFFPPQIANAIREADLGREGMAVRREAAVLMVDLRGFSALSTTLAPKETLALISDYQRLVVPIIHRHGGAVDKYLGDGILATFGAIEPRESFAQDAFAALRDILVEGGAWEERRRYDGEPAPRVVAALDIGRLTLGVVGADGRLEFTIIGHVVNRVSKLEKHARLLRARGMATQRALTAAFGKDDPPDLSLDMRRSQEVPGLAGEIDVAIVTPR